MTKQPKINIYLAALCIAQAATKIAEKQRQSVCKSLYACFEM